MRDIKFRAWDKYDCEMLEDVQNEYDSRLMSFSQALLAEYYEVMQYTGFKDRNGKEIYESDIICYISSDDEYRPKGHVRMNEGTWRVFWKRDEAMSDENMRKDLYFWATEREIEVIGNIWEDGDLINGQEPKEN